MKGAKLLLPEVKSMQLSSVVSNTKQLKARGEVDILVVDYIQSVKVEGCRGIYENVEAVSSGLKELALACDIPVLALSQLNRDKDRAKREPCMADLKGASQIENDASSILFLSINQNEAEYGEARTPIFASVAKNRGGPVGSYATSRINRQCRFGTTWRQL